MYYTKPKLLYYRLAQAVCRIVGKYLFRPQVLRNEIKDAKGPYVVIANHQSMLDFLTLIGLTKRPMSFVISQSFYRSLPITGFLDKLGVIPKQQFQTTVSDMKKMKSVIKNGQPLVIYPAGLMCEDGLSTPVPLATYKFLQWLKADVYVARCRGTYFAMPKWSKKIRPGKTTMDVYKLFTKEELAAADLETIQRKADEALLYDAYREQEALQFRYKQNDNIEGLEHVLYKCPHCHGEFNMEVRDGNTLHCRACGYEAKSDELGFFHNTKGFGPEIRYVSDWSRFILDSLTEQVRNGEDVWLEDVTAVHMIDPKTHKFVDVGHGTLRLNEHEFAFHGTLRGKKAALTFPTDPLPTLPFKPGKYMEIQHGENIYRCYLRKGHLVMKFINLVKIFYVLHQESTKEQIA